MRLLPNLIAHEWRKGQNKLPAGELASRCHNGFGAQSFAMACRKRCLYRTQMIDARFLKPDNNVAGNAIRPFVLGRKNGLFAGAPKGAQASATKFSLIETAKANGLEPYKYLRDVFEKLPTLQLIQHRFSEFRARRSQSLCHLAH
jgi:hypothetical protein